VFEGTPGNVSVFVSDLSDRRRAVAVRLVKAPAHGKLFDPATGQRLVNGSRLATAAPWPYAAPLRVTYMDEGGYFNSPGARHNGSALALDEGSGYDPNGDGHAMPYGHADSFWFQAEVAAEAEGAVQSRRAAQAVVVVNVNDPPMLTGPPGPLTTQALGSSASSSGAASSADELAIEGLALADGDRDVDPVKVLLRLSFTHLLLHHNEFYQWLFRLLLRFLSSL